MADIPERLHQRAYLAAYDSRRHRLVTRGSHREMINAAGVIRLEERRLLGLIPAGSRVEPANPLVVAELIDRSRRIVLGPGPVGRDDPRDIALAALAVAVELPTISSGPERRQHRDRIREADAVVAPIAKALQSVAASNRNAG